MTEIFRFLKLTEPYILILLGIVGIVFIRRLISGIIEYKDSQFGLEKDRALRRIIAAGGVTIFLLLIAAGEFIFVLVGNENPSAYNIQITATIDLSSTSTPLINGVSSPDNNRSSEVPPGSAQQMQEAVCQPGKVEWNYPKDGDEIRGKVELKGTANILDFGFYQYDYSQDNTNWNAIAVGTKIVSNDILGVWDTSLYTPGDYFLRLLVRDNQNNTQSPCIIKISILAP
jgi:hypothetical protein